MRKLDTTEQQVVNAIAANGGSYCPSTDAAADPSIIAIIKSLKSKKRIFEVEDTDLPTFRLTGRGFADAQS